MFYSRRFIRLASSLVFYVSAQISLHPRPYLKQKAYFSLFFFTPFHLALFFFIKLITVWPDIVYLLHNISLCTYFLSPQLELRFPDVKDFDLFYDFILSA